MVTSHEAKTSRSSKRFDDRMSESDALIWNIEKDPSLRSTITTIMVLEGPVDAHTVTETFERASRVIPRLRQRVRSNPFSLAPPRWEIDPNYDLDYHLRRARVPGDGSMADLLAMCGPISMQGFDRARPLWEATMVDGLADGLSAIIMKFHHSITDGIGGVELMLELLDLEPDAEKSSMPPLPPVHVLNQTERFIDALGHETRVQSGLLREGAATGVETLKSIAYDPSGALIASTELASSVGRLLSPDSTPMSAVATRRSLSSHLEVLSMPLTNAKKVGHLVGGTINDTFIAGIVRGMDLYHREHGINQHFLRMGMPINVRGAASSHDAGNEWVPARFKIDLRHDSLIDLLSHVHDCAAHAKDEPANQLVKPMSLLLNKLPTTVVTQLFGSMMKGLDFQASNIPGSPVQMYLQGVPVKAVYPFGPLAGAAANITLLSYMDDLNIGVNVDPVAIPDMDLFMETLREGYDELLELC